jgi:hypothetical protein
MRKQTYRAFLQPAFLICAAVLAAASGGMSLTIRTLGMHLRKEPLPLKKSLELLDKRSLGPYRVVSKNRIENPEIVRAMGTEDYIEWVLEDTEAEAGSPLRLCSLFITYYGLADRRVTHTPDECYIGVGFQRLGSEGVTFLVDRDDGRKEMPGKYVVFSAGNSGQWSGDVRFAVLYLFHVNGSYTGSREATRFMISQNIFGRHSYYSKVEWKFYNTRLGQMVYPSKEEAVAASGKLLSAVLPVLERDHWPRPPGNESEVESQGQEKELLTRN